MARLDNVPQPAFWLGQPAAGPPYHPRPPRPALSIVFHEAPARAARRRPDRRTGLAAGAAPTGWRASACRGRSRCWRCGRSSSCCSTRWWAWSTRAGRRISEVALDAIGVAAYVGWLLSMLHNAVGIGREP